MNRGFIITSHYDVVDEIPHIHLYGRLDTNESFEAIVKAQPYFFIKEQDKTNALKLISLETQSTSLQTLQHEQVARVHTTTPKQISELRKLLEDNNIPCFEADIRFTQRYLIDNNILTQIHIQGEKKKGKKTDVLFEFPEITPASKDEEVISPTMLSFDIETDAKASTILSISLYNKEVQEVIVVANEALKKNIPKHATLVADEKELMITALERIQEIDPDILTGWNVIDFDLQVMQARAKKLNVPFVVGRTTNQTTLRLQSSFFRDSSVHCEGRIVLDGIQLLKSSFVKLDDYKLNTAAKHFLKDAKIIQDDERFAIIERMYEKDPETFVAYNLKDSKLVYDILEVSHIFELTVQRSLLTGLHMDNVKASIASFDSLYLRELRVAGYVAPSTRPTDGPEGLGGYVMTSKPGIYANILVLDFKSLYPSVMRTFNIDPLSYQGTVEELERKNIDITNKEKFIIAPNNAVFSNNEGILPRILKTLWDEREKARKNGNELARYAIKIQMNSMYGVLASQNSRFHIRAISNAITYFCQHFIKMTAKEIEKHGYEVIYGDTDSVFVNTKTDNILEANNIGKSLEEGMNVFLKQHITETYACESVLELEFEKQYTRFFIPKVRGGEEGAKKRYAGLKISNIGTEKQSVQLDFTGLEFVRRDWTSVAKEFQLTLLDLIFADKDVKNFITQFVTDLKAGKYDELLMYRKSLRKNIDAYTKTTPPHVKAARLLDKIEGSVITYVMTLDGPQPIEKITSPLDYDHYIEKQIKPIADSILLLQETSFDEIMQGSTQQGLDKFF
jgi:DNA polymerase-2